MTTHTPDPIRELALEAALARERARGAVAVKVRDKLIEVYEREPPYCGLCMTDEDSEAHSRWTEEDLLPARAAALSDPSPAVQALMELAEAAEGYYEASQDKPTLESTVDPWGRFEDAVERWKEARGG